MSTRILIADDNPVVRTALRQLLSGSDREILEAENGADAVAKTHEHRPDIVILDLAMPAMDGLSAAREISRQFPHLPLLMCTMHWSPHLQVEAQKSGIRKVLSKADAGTLISTVAEWIASRPDPEAAPLSPLVLPPETLAPPPIIAATPLPAERPDAQPDSPDEVQPIKAS